MSENHNPLGVSDTPVYQVWTSFDGSPPAPCREKEKSNALRGNRNSSCGVPVVSCPISPSNLQSQETEGIESGVLCILRWQGRARSIGSGGIAEIRAQFGEQARALEGRSETQAAVLGELGDYFRRRAEVEADYARQLDKLARSTLAKHKAEKAKFVSFSSPLPGDLKTLWDC